MNWVDRLFAREQNLKDVTALWSDVYSAIASAVDSWNRLYRKDQSAIELIDSEENSRFQIAVPQAQGTLRIDVTLSGRKFSARYTNTLPTRTFQIDADHESAFVTAGAERCDADEVSRRILEPALRPEKLGGTRATPIV